MEIIYQRGDYTDFFLFCAEKWNELASAKDP
jgi:hypothetical protein